MAEDLSAFPIYPYLDELCQTLATHGSLLLSAETGAGKTTLFPWKLLAHPGFSQNKILLLEPRRLAARAAANRIARLLGENVGQTVGIRTRIETLISAKTRLEVVTEGVLTRLLQEDPSLAGYGTILFDEFHTRSLQGDLGLALAWEARKVFRHDLKLAILSATLPSETIQQAFGPWPLITVPGRSFPVKVVHFPPLSANEKPWEAAVRLAREAHLLVSNTGPGGVLCFLPGFWEMQRASELLIKQFPALQKQVYLLHGQMPPQDQQKVLEPPAPGESRIIFATNVAETSLTIPDIKAVVDIGLERRIRFSPRTGMDHWDTVMISQASAEQRKGRAGRTGPGICLRWWPAQQMLEPFSPPEILEADLAPLVLETALWGATSPTDLLWLTPLPEASVRQAQSLLQELDLLNPSATITSLGRRAAALALHPRLSAMVLKAHAHNQLDTAVVLAALLENEDLLIGNDPDLRDRVAAFQEWANNQQPRINLSAAKRVWEDVRRSMRTLGQPLGSANELQLKPETTGVLLLSAYPDRAAKKTRLDDRVTSRWLLASGRGAWLKGALSQCDFLAIADLDGGEQDARIFLAAPVSQRDLEEGKAGPSREIWTLQWNQWKPKAKLEIKVGSLVLKEKNGHLPSADILQTEAMSRLKQLGLASLPWRAGTDRMLARCRFIEKWGKVKNWPTFSDADLLETAGTWLIPFGKWDGTPVWDEQSLMFAMENYLGWNLRKQLDELAPENFTLPSGSNKRLDYTDEAPVLSARLQEFFGCITTPKLCGQPLLLDLLSPAGRTVQRTRDLDGFWDRAYPEVKKELMGRYPRHYWPDNPREAKATARSKPRK